MAQRTEADDAPTQDLNEKMISTSVMETTDGQLLDDARDGDAESFRILVERYQGQLIGYLTRMVGCPLQAEDFAQEAFLRIYSRAHRYQEQGQFKSYLYRTATNLVRSAIRKQRTREALSTLIPAAPESVPAEQDRRIRRQELGGQIREAIARLPLKFREPLVLYEVEDWPYQQIAEHLGCRPGTVKSRIHRARSLVREQLEPYLDGELT